MSSKKSRRPADGHKDILILFIEDHPLFVERMMPKLCATWTSQGRTWSSQCKHAPTFEEAERLLEPEMPGFDVAIHDGNIPRFENEKADSPEAGDDLYLLLIQKKIPTLVMSAETVEGILDREPYQSFPPRLGFLQKNAGVEKIRLAIETYFLEKDEP